MNEVKGIVKTLTLLSLLTVMPLAQSAGVPPVVQDVLVVESEGIVRELHFATNEIIIGGSLYKVAPDARVTIRGSYGAFTMLENGMKVAVQYRQFPDLREIFEIEQLPDNREIEEF